MAQLRSAALGLAAILWTNATPVRAQGTADTTSPPPSASLLRRLAEAVDGQRTGRPVWVVIQRAFPHRVEGVYADAVPARAVAGRLAGYSVLGPFVTPVDSGTQTVMYTVDPCPGKHDSVSHCPDTTRSNGTALQAMPAQSVDSLVVTIYGKDSRIHRTYAPTEVDALFFTLSAIDKFVMPYYTRLYGPDVAAEMRRNYLRQLSRAGGGGR